jgi:hypothetical protein
MAATDREILIGVLDAIGVIYYKLTGEGLKLAIMLAADVILGAQVGRCGEDATGIFHRQQIKE